MSEIYDYAREAIIPRVPLPDSYLYWYPFLPPSSTRLSFDALQTAASRLLDLAESRDQLDQLAGEIEAARKRITNWTAGDVLLAMVRCRAGRYDEVKRLVPRALENLKKDPIASSTTYGWYAAWALGLELENRDETRDLALTVYADSLDNPYAFLQFRLVSEKVPYRRLVHLYISEGRYEEARRALLRVALREKKFPDSYAEQTVKLYRAVLLFWVAPTLVQLGYGSDAVPLFGEAIKLVEELPSIPSTYFQNAEQVPRQLRDGLKAALDGLSAAELAPIAGRLVSDASDDRNPETGQDQAKSSKAKARDQALDLVTLVYPRDLDKARLRSLLAESLAACDASQLAALDEPLETAPQGASRGSLDRDRDRTESPGVGRLEADRPGARRPQPAGRADAPGAAAAGRPGQRPATGRGRAAGPALAGRPRLRERLRRRATCDATADRLAARAIEAARRQADNLVLLAMLREQGELALAHGDPKAAEAAWGRMLEMVLPAQPARARRTQAARRRHRPSPGRDRRRPRRRREPVPARSPRRREHARHPDDWHREPSGLVFAPKQAESTMEKQ